MVSLASLKFLDLFLLPVLAASGVAGSGDDGESVPSTKRVVARDTETKDGAKSGTIRRGTTLVVVNVFSWLLLPLLLLLFLPLLLLVLIFFLLLVLAVGVAKIGGI